jgi:hypothetical protein
MSKWLPTVDRYDNGNQYRSKKDPAQWPGQLATAFWQIRCIAQRV